MGLQKKKAVFIPFMILILLIIIFATYGVQGVDVMTVGVKSDQYYYRLSYEGVINGLYFEKGYMFITSLFGKLGFSYVQFKFVAGTVSAILISYSIKGFDVNYAYVLLLYAVSSFSSDLEQTRSFFAMSLVIFAMHYLYDQSGGILNIVKYCILVLLAGTIHTAALFFLILVLTKQRRGGPIFDLLYPFIVFNSVLCKVVINDIPEIRGFIEQLLLALIHNERILIFMEKTTGMGFYACVVLHGILLLLFYHYKDMVWNKEYTAEKTKGFLQTIYRSLQLLSFAIPLYIFSTVYLRLFRSLFVVFFVALLKCAKEADGEFEYRNSTMNVGLALLLFVFLFVYVFDPISITMTYYKAIMML